MLDLNTYTLDDYITDVASLGLKPLWNNIISSLRENGLPSSTKAIFTLDNLGELYEIGMAETDKQAKKEFGKYYTPKDVAHVMSEWLVPLEGENIADVGCGTGQLILSYIDVIGKDVARSLALGGHIYLYDCDEIALSICRTSISLVLGVDTFDKINACLCDFLDASTTLPDNCKVISNPPYYKILEVKDTWDKNSVIADTKELYSAFMHKILEQSRSFVIITPYSFISGKKFFSLREELSAKTGFIVSFDNVPGSIFNGRKHGIWNTNTANSVRAAITVIDGNGNTDGKAGIQTSPLIRFRTDEREQLLKSSVLRDMVSNKKQIVDNTNKAFYKCDKALQELYDKWNAAAGSAKMSSLIEKQSVDGVLVLHTINTCRYFTLGCNRELDRTGLEKFYPQDSKTADYLYCMMNSSFAYWWWRLYDGGITYPKSLLLSLPVFITSLTDEEMNTLSIIANEMRQNEEKYLVYKMNAGKNQESIKFPTDYRDRINHIFLKHFDALDVEEALKKIHDNHVF